MKKWLGENWFKVAVIFCLLLIWGSLRSISDNVFFAADVIEAELSALNTNLDSRLYQIAN